MGDSIEGTENPPEAQNVAVVDFSAFLNYIRKAVTILLPEEDIVPPALNAALEDKNNQESIRKFLGDSQVSTLFIQRCSSKGGLGMSHRFFMYVQGLSRRLIVFLLYKTIPIFWDRKLEYIIYLIT